MISFFLIKNKGFLPITKIMDYNAYLFIFDYIHNEFPKTLDSTQFTNHRSCERLKNVIFHIPGLRFKYFRTENLNL